MKKITAVFLSVVLTLALAACGSASGNSGTPGGSAGADTQTYPAEGIAADTAGTAGGITSGLPGTETRTFTGMLGIGSGSPSDAADAPADGNENIGQAVMDAAAAATDSASQAAADSTSAMAAATDSASQAAADSTSAMAAATDSAAQAATEAAAGSTDAAAAATDSTAEAAAEEEQAWISVSPEQLLKDVKGRYDELFTVLCDPKYDQVWLDRCEAIVGKKKAAECVEMLKNAYTGTLSGEEAEEAYRDDPEEGRLDSYFHQGVERFVFDGSKISGLDKDGKEVFSHEYTYLQDIALLQDMAAAEPLKGYVYKTSDKDPGEFKYFVLLADTPETTCHIEFRHGRHMRDLTGLTEGPYAYWLASGIPADPDEKIVEKAIRFFAEKHFMSMAPEGGTIEIGTAQGLAEFARNVSGGSKNGYEGTTIKLTDDIDCSGIEWVPIGRMDMDDMTDMSCMFRGTFNGKGHVISNITFSSKDPICGAGMFGINLGTIKHLTLENVNISCTDKQSMGIGGLVGYNMYGDIHDVMLTGQNTIQGVSAVGGLAGGSTGKVYDCNVDGTAVNVLGDNEFTDGKIVPHDNAACGGLVIGNSSGGSIDSCNAKGTVTAGGNEPVGLGGIAGCLQMTDSVTNCVADVKIVTEKGGHAIGGLCGYGGTHSDGKIAQETEGIVSTVYPGRIAGCHVTVEMDVPGATHVGGLVGTGIFYYGEETAFKITDCSVKGEINGAVTPGAVFGRAMKSVIESCEMDVRLDGKKLEAQTGTTDTMLESTDQAIPAR